MTSLLDSIINPRGYMEKERGFTLVELLVVIMLTSFVFVGGGLALRQYWLVQSLEGQTDETVTQLREMQERVVAESAPLVYGARFRAGSNVWTLVQYDPRVVTQAGYFPGKACKPVPGLIQRYGNSVVVAGEPDAPQFEEGADAVNECRFVSGWGSDEFVFFFARGNATQGQLVLRSQALDRTRTITVNGITGRVDKS
jgi:prepilin-type N-terminal cleavage/methylation domain-containing protein